MFRICQPKNSCLGVSLWFSTRRLKDILLSFILSCVGTFISRIQQPIRHRIEEVSYIREGNSCRRTPTELRFPLSVSVFTESVI